MAPMFFLSGPPPELVITEFVYFLIVFSLCLIVYFRTNSIYQLTKHKGILYFRNIFLFFSLAYLFRIALVSILLGTEFDNFFVPRPFIGILFTLVSFFSTMAILSMVAVSLPKFSKSKNLMPLLFAVAFLSSAIAFATRSQREFLLIQTLVFLGAVVFAFVKERKDSSRHFASQNRITYFLLFVFWLIDGIALNRRIIPYEYKLPLYALSIIVFFWVYHRVSKRLSSNVKKKG